jgi:hypothetical protein
VSTTDSEQHQDQKKRQQNNATLKGRKKKTLIQKVKIKSKNISFTSSRKRHNKERSESKIDRKRDHPSLQ